MPEQAALAIAAEGVPASSQHCRLGRSSFGHPTNCIELAEIAVNDAIKSRTEKATVRILRPNNLEPVAQDVLVPGGYILTAAHCIDWEGAGGMALEDRLEDRYVETYLVRPCALEPVADIAALAGVDWQERFEEALAFEEFCEATEPVPVSADDFPYVAESIELNPPVPILVLTHKGMWMSGTARRLSAQLTGTAAAQFDGHVEGGTSGSPVINDDGFLVGVISQSSTNDKEYCVEPIPRPHLALPAWISNRITAPRVTR